MRDIKKAAFIGLGVMGAPMARHLVQKAGISLQVYNRTAAKTDLWLAGCDGQAAATPQQAGRDVDAVFLCVGNDDDLREVLTGQDGLVYDLSEGTIIVDHTTASADISREMADFFASRGCYFLDAPVSGGQGGAESGQLSVMAGGDRAAFDHIAPIMRTAYAKEARYMGESGAGQLAKMVNQICIAGIIQGLSEGLAFGMKAGLDMDELLAVISKGAAQSWQMDNRGPTMVKDEFDFGFAVDWMVKDLQIALEESNKNGASLEATELIWEYYHELSSQGHGRLDTSSLIKRLPH